MATSKNKGTIKTSKKSEKTEIDGLLFFKNVISDSDVEEELETFLQSEEDWFPVTSSANSRIVRHYGFRYNYSSKGVTEPAPPFPSIISKLREIIRSINAVPDDLPLNQCIINRYLPGQGISAHIDSLSYADFVCCFTFGSGAELEFTKSDKNPVFLYTELNSLYIMSGEARYEWKHQMRDRQNDTNRAGDDPRRIARGTRYSITFRSVIMK